MLAVYYLIPYQHSGIKGGIEYIAVYPYCSGVLGGGFWRNLPLWLIRAVSSLGKFKSKPFPPSVEPLELVAP